MAQSNFSPETQMLGYGYKPELSEGAVKCPIFQTSTFVFKSAEEGKAFFEMAHGKPGHEGEVMGLIYSRINNPDMEILEERLKLWDEGEAAAAFSSGMSAIATSLVTYLSPGDVLLYSNPLYGGTHKFVHHILTHFGVEVIGFRAGQDLNEVEQILVESGHAKKLKMIYVETPANPTNDLIDIEMCNAIAKKFSTPDRKVLVTVDNTYMGPLWQHPLKHGADIVLYSATKYIGGHSDVIAGAAVGSKEIIGKIKKSRTFFGTMIDPHTSWLLMRSLETLKIRMEAAAINAEKVADYLSHHPKVEKVYYLGYTAKNNPEQVSIFTKQYLSNGAMLSFDIIGGEKEAFTFLNNLKHIKLAVSLGGTESLAEHPASMTHSDVPYEEKQELHITDKLVRLSIGIENYKDIIWDIEQALEKVKMPVIEMVM
ncbi:MAG: cystathionine gamma-synthase family protein [Chitinophagaceae bacterium]|nr:cystathionine gamma-synthase family protein [Chitinophagaceae bacterium]MBK8300026.1 cystathionine gamma-synthase family protein [Chitinophagaceae bacterium]MBK9939547.1 cystathionine gamma-synthase family protein [Chitinophagaceae bacterium]MBL0067264.1 cystathionine gamma-synthase family protein [Chitinophagaceae bacterium]MBP6233248.1 cystathionine gamma-synthase family protein [Chitinophagaceae bacterium]